MKNLTNRILIRTLTPLLSLALIAYFIFPVYISIALEINELPEAGTMVKQSTPTVPPMLKGLIIYPDKPFQFDFILNKGTNELTEEELKQESMKLIKYFLASLTFPENEMWVNLSPYEKDRIIPQAFGETEMGQDLLAQDYLLKQLTASLIYPEEELGRKFWEKVYEEAHTLFGTTDVPVNTFNKVWIVPDQVRIFENVDRAYVVESGLEVMLEEDYLSMKKSFEETDPDTEPTSLPEEFSNVSTEVLREVIIPEIKREVNEGENFAKLRQIYNSFILAAWYKRNLKESLLNLTYSNQKKVSGIETEEKNVKQKIYDQYLDAFKKGVYDYIKEDYDLSSNIVRPRKYFSGGINLEKNDFDSAMLTINPAEEEGNFIVSNIFQVPQARTETIPALEEPRVRMDAAMLREKMTEIFRTAPTGMRVLRGGWEINQDEQETILDWLETKVPSVAVNRIIFKKFIHYIMAQYTSGSHKQALEMLDILADKWNITPKHTRSLAKWLIGNQFNIKQISEKALSDFFRNYVEAYNKFPYLKSEFVYLLPPTETISQDKKITMAGENIKTMTSMFSQDFVSSKTIIKATIPGTDYFIGMRFGLAESTFGVYVGIGVEQEGVDPLEGIFIRVGIDSQGESLRVNMMQGVVSKQNIINEDFPDTFRIHPAVALLHVALELAYQGHVKLEEGVLSPERLPFRALLGVRPEFIPTMQNGQPTLNIMASYSKFGLRRSMDFVRWQSVDHLVRNTLAGRLAARDLRANTIRKFMTGFAELQEIPWDRAMLVTPDENKGGIDFNPNFLAFESEGVKVELNTPMDLEGFENININGLEPFIMNIMPINNIYQLLGVKKEEKEEERVLSRLES